MVNYFLNFLFIFLMLSSFSHASDDNTKAENKLEAKIQNEFGYDLTHVPFFLRFAYDKQFNKDWKDTDYPQRKAFLIDYENNLAEERAKYKEEAKTAAADEKDRLLEKREKQRKENEFLKEQLAEEKADKLADKELQKQFKSNLTDQAKELAEMQREYEKTRRDKGMIAGQGVSQGSPQESDQDSSQSSY